MHRSGGSVFRSTDRTQFSDDHTTSPVPRASAIYPPRLIGVTAAVLHIADVLKRFALFKPIDSFEQTVCADAVDVNPKHDIAVKQSHSG